VQNHRFQWLQLPPASSRQDSGPKISLRRAGALAEPGSPSPPPIAGAMGRAGRDRDRQQRPAGQPRKHRVDQRPPGLTTAARPRTEPLGRHHHLQPAPPIQLRPGSRQVPAGDRLLGRAPAPGAGAQLAAGDRKLQRRRHRDEGTGLPRPSPAPRRTTAAARAGRAAPPRSAPAPGGTPGSPPGRRPRRLQHRGGLGPTADRRVAGQPDQLQQPPQRSGDVQLASDPSATCAAARATGTPAARAG
jgi:hypothetical protein